MAQLKDLIVNGNSRLIGDAFAQTPAAGTDNQEVATTAFVKTAINSAITSAKQEKTITMPISNATQTVTPDTGKVLSKVTVNPMAAATIKSGAGTASATVSVAPGTVTVAKTADGNVSAGTATTTKPTSGYYAAVKATAASNTTGATASITGTVAAPSVTTEGYISSNAGTKNTNTISGTAKATTSEKSSSVTYVPITTGALSASDSAISGGSFTPSLTYNSTSGKFDFGGSEVASGTAYAKVTTGGYVTNSQDTSKALSATVSASGSVNKVGTGVTITGTTTKAPTLARTEKPSGDTWTDAASGSATTTKPTSGAYVQIDAAANTGTLTATPKVTAAGYGDTTNYSATAATTTVGAAKATTAYVPIKAGSASISGSISVSGSDTINPGTNTISKNTNTNVSSGTPTTTKPSSGFYVAVDAATAQNTGSVSVSGSKALTPSVTEGYVTAGTAGTVSASGTGSVTVPAKSASTTYFPITSATASKTDATASATITKSASATVTATGFTESSTATDYYVTASANSGKAKASVTASSASVTAGYSAGISTSTAAKSAETTEESVASKTIYIPKAALSASGTGTATTTVAPGNVTIANNTTAVTGKTRLDASLSTATTGISTYYMAIKANAAANTSGATSSITGTASAGVSTAGYAPSNLSGSGNVTGTALAKTSAKDSSVYYIPIASGSCTVAGGELSKGTASGGDLSGGELSGGDLSGGDLSGGSVTGGALTAGDGSVSATGTNITLAAATTTQPASGAYITVQGSGSVTRAAITRATITRAAVTRATVTRAVVSRAAFSQAVTRAAVTDEHTAGYIPAKSATSAIAAATSTVSLAAGTLAQGTLDVDTLSAATIASTTIDSESKSSNTATKYYPISTTSLSKSGGTVSCGTGWISAASLTVTADDLGITTRNDSGNVTLDATTTTKSYAAGYYPHAHGATHTTVTRASTTLTSSADTANAKLTFTAGNNQDTGFVTGSNSTKTATVTLTASGQSVTASDGTNSVSKSVASGTDGTPTAEKGTASGNSISVTPSVTNTAGYITGGKKTGTAVSVSVSDASGGNINNTTKCVFTYTGTESPQSPYIKVKISGLDSSATWRTRGRYYSTASDTSLKNLSVDAGGTTSIPDIYTAFGKVDPISVSGIKTSGTGNIKITIYYSPIQSGGTETAVFDKTFSGASRFSLTAQPAYSGFTTPSILLVVY